MKSWAKRTAKTVVFVTGFAAAGGGLAGVALAGTGTPSTVPANAGNISAVSGNQIYIPISIPVNICGNAAAVLGFATASCHGGASVSGAVSHGEFHAGGVGTPSTGAGNVTAGAGNLIVIPIETAVNACGNAVGSATAHCLGGVWLPGGGPVVVAGSGDRGIGNLGILSRNMVRIPVSVPVNVCGNAAAVLGRSTAGCAGGASVGVEQVAWHEMKPIHQASQMHQTHQKKTGKTGPHPLKPVQLASIGTQPAVSGALGLVQPLLRGIPLLDGTNLTAATQHSATSLPVARLTALQASVAGQPMSDNSLVALAVGALLTGAAALKVASRGARARRAVTASAGATVIGASGQEVTS